MINVPAFNRGALPFDTNSDPDPDAEGSLTSPACRTRHGHALLAQLTISRLSSLSPKLRSRRLPAGGRSAS